MIDARLPRWFRAVVIVLFGALFTAFFVVRGGLRGDAQASGWLRSALDLTSAPLRSAVGRFEEPANGSYVLNGMRVAYATQVVPTGPRESIAKFAEAFARTGYRVKVVTVDRQAVLVGIHPETRMMLTVRPGRDRAGRHVVRLSQQDLSELDPAFRAEIPGVPLVSGARQATLVTDHRSASLAFGVDASPSWVAGYYAREMRMRGWEPLTPPIDSSSGDSRTLFFSKDGSECSIVAIVNPKARSTLVLIAVDAPRES